jgi:glycosyltransferase involved in cell wall biosynthesis
MNILMIFCNNPLRDSGAVTLDLFNEFKAKGNTVKLLVNTYNPGYPDGIISMETFYLFWRKRIINKVKRMLGLVKTKITDNRYHFHEIDDQKTFYKTDELLKKANIKPDAIIILFAKNFINSKNIYELHKKTGKPVYWMMYDTSPVTGGCHYTWDCLGYQNSCGNCPGLFSNDQFDVTYQNLLYKKKYIDKTNISLVLASEWQYLQAKKSIIFKDKPIHKIFISINPDVFKIVPKEISRKKVGVATEKKVIFFGAKTFRDERKGFKYLLEALKILKLLLKEESGLMESVHLLIAGEETEKFKNELPFEYSNLGLLNNSDGVASAYQAADIYLCPSIEDAGPSMVNQSIMCGTPVVSFAQGVSLDIVVTGKTGYLARLKDSEDMAKGIYNILKMADDEYMEMKMSCRKMALELFHPEVSINKWLKIINTM